MSDRQSLTKPAKQKLFAIRLALVRKKAEIFVIIKTIHVSRYYLWDNGGGVSTLYSCIYRLNKDTSTINGTSNNGSTDIK